jgi:hypothetical protein
MPDAVGDLLACHQPECMRTKRRGDATACRADPSAGRSSPRGAARARRGAGPGFRFGSRWFLGSGCVRMWWYAWMSAGSVCGVARCGGRDGGDGGLEGAAGGARRGEGTDEGVGWS